MTTSGCAHNLSAVSNSPVSSFNAATPETVPLTFSSSLNASCAQVVRVFVGGDDPNLALDVNSQVGTLRHSAPRTCHEFRVDQGGLRPQANLGETPLHVCSIFGATRVAALLLANGADPFLTDSEEWAAFHYAARFGHQEVLEMVRRKMRFDSGFDGEQQPVTSDGWSALHIAARFQKLDIITYLLSAGAAKESRDKLGRTALHVAVKHGLADAVQHLLAHRLDVDAKTDTGESPGHVALRGGELLLDLIDLLLTHGLNMEARDNTVRRCCTTLPASPVQRQCGV